MAVKILGNLDVSGSMNIAASDVPNLAASKITSGTLGVARIPDLSGTYTQALSISGSTLTLSNSGGSVTLPTNTGPQGDQGDPGPEGPAGSNGTNGSNGSNGSDGADGSNGSDGAMYTADKYLFTTSQTYTATGTKINIASQELDGTTGTTISSSRITFNATGTYMIMYNINWQSLYANRSTFGAVVQKNGTTINGSCNLQYFRHSSYGHKSTTNASFVVSASNGNYIEVETFLHSGVANHKVTSTGGDTGAIQIIRLS